MDIITQPIFIILGVVAAALLALHVATRRPSGRRTADPLVTACLGDRAKAARLVSFESTRAPGISPAEAHRRALDRLSRDRSR